VIAPFDPDDDRSRRLHRGARPQPLAMPERFVSLGRTVGIPANGAVSNLALTARALLRVRTELRSGAYDIAHLHEPVVPHAGWDSLCSVEDLPLVGTFHTYSENQLTNGIAAVVLGGRRRMNRLHVRIAVSEAAAWTARRFYGGRYQIIPNGVHLHDPDALSRARADGPLRIVFVGQAVERKGLSVLLRAFEALREHVPATLTLVGAGASEVAHLLLDDNGVSALGKVSEQRKRAELEQADIVCAPSLHGESFGMVLTEAFAAGTPVVASDIPGYRDVVRDGVDGLLVPPGDPLALGEALRRLAFDEAGRERMARAARERAERFAWPRVAREVSDCYGDAVRVGTAASSIGRLAVRHGLAPADLKPRIPAERLPSLQPRATPAGAERKLRTMRRAALLTGTLAGGALAGLALQRVGVTAVVASLVASKPGLLLAGLALMCCAMFARALGWHTILSAAPTWRQARRRDAMQGTFIGVLMSATLPARMGEPSRALIVARRLGRARETLPLVLGTMVSQTLLNLLALAALGAVALASINPFDAANRELLVVGLVPLAALLAASLGPLIVSSVPVARARRRERALIAVGRVLQGLRDGVRPLRSPNIAAAAALAQATAWAMQWAACWLLLIALGIDPGTGAPAAAAVLFAVNVTAVMPATPANIGIFQAACVAVLAPFHVSAPEAIAYGIVLQSVEIATALLMGLPALVTEGLSWREVRLRTLHFAPVRLAPLPEPGARGTARAS
jgi:phosphatidylinositol alpha-mannosyltransferase